MTNKRASALRYLLLWHLWDIKDRENEKAFWSVSSSLAVHSEEGEYVITWTAKGKNHRKVYRYEDFSFFVWPDPSLGRYDVLGQHERTIKNAESFARFALGAGSSGTFPVGNVKSKRLAWKSAFLVTFGVGLWWVGGLPLLPAIVILVLSMPDQQIVWRKTLNAVLLAGLVPTGFPYSAAITGLAYAWFQFLDPNPRLRNIRVAVSLCSAGVGILAVMIGANVPLLNCPLICFIPLAAGVWIKCWIEISPWNYVTLLSPWLSIGLYLDGASAGAYLLLATGLLSVTVGSRVKHF